MKYIQLLILLLTVTTSFSQNHSKFIDHTSGDIHYEWYITFNNELDLIESGNVLTFPGMQLLNNVNNKHVVVTPIKTRTQRVDQLIGNDYYTITPDKHVVRYNLSTENLEKLDVLPTLGVTGFNFNEINNKLGIVTNEENNIWITNDNGYIYKSVFDIEHFPNSRQVGKKLSIYTPYIYNDSTFFVSFTYKRYIIVNNGLINLITSGFLYTNNGGLSWELTELPVLNNSNFCVTHFYQENGIMYFTFNGGVYYSDNNMKTVKLKNVIKINDNNFKQMYKGVKMNMIDAKPFVLFEIE